MRVIVVNGRKCIPALFRFEIIENVKSADRDFGSTAVINEPGPLEFGDVFRP